MKAAETLILFCAAFSMRFLSVSSVEEAFCFGSGYNDEKREGLGFHSMGATPWYDPLLNIVWASNHWPKQYIRPDIPSLTITSVVGKDAQGNKAVLNGWLHFSLERKQGQFNAVAVWALTEKEETFGQFVNVPNVNCRGGMWDHPAFVPCSAAPKDATLNPNMFLFTDETGRKFTKINLLWKADTTFCSMPKSFFFVIALTGTKWNQYSSITPFFVKDGATMDLGPVLYRSAKLEPRFYGAASAIFDKSKLSCSDDISLVPLEWLRGSAAAAADIDNLDDKYYVDRWDPTTGFERGLVVTNRSVCKAQKEKYSAFGGRCMEGNWQAKQRLPQRVFGSITSPPACLHYSDTIDPTELTNYFEHNGGSLIHFKDYITGQRKDEVHKKPCDCPPVPTSIEVNQTAASARLALEWIDSHPYTEPERGCKQYSGKAEYNKHGLCLISEAGEYTRGVRLWHTIANLLCSMVIIPVSCFMARYLKGSIPIAHTTGVAYIPIKPWYMLHIFLVLPVMCMYASGVSSVRRQFSILGESLTASASFHRTSGFIVMAFFGFQCVSGLLRPINTAWRRIFIYIHWAFGYGVYYFGAVLCILTYRIPASPFSFKKLLDPSFPVVYYHFAPLIMIVWLVIDVTVHICVTFYVVNYDKARLNVTKLSYFPVFLPMRVDNYYLRTHDYDDLQHEDHCLNKVLLFYTVFCVAFFIFTITAMTYLNVEQNHGYGPMQCTHSPNHTFTAGGHVSQEELKHQHHFCN